MFLDLKLFEFSGPTEESSCLRHAINNLIENKAYNIGRDVYNIRICEYQGKDAYNIKMFIIHLPPFL